MQQRNESVGTPDGSFDLTVWVPDAGTGPGLLLLQEIYGVGEYIRAVADDLARPGYPNVEMCVEEEAGHAFHNRVAPMFYQPEPASRAWQRTQDFLGRHLPVRQPA